jgi:hypothetical protein
MVTLRTAIIAINAHFSDEAFMAGCERASAEGRTILFTDLPDTMLVKLLIVAVVCIKGSGGQMTFRPTVQRSRVTPSLVKLDTCKRSLVTVKKRQLFPIFNVLNGISSGWRPVVYGHKSARCILIFLRQFHGNAIIEELNEEQ